MTNWCWVWQYWFVRSNTTALSGDGCSSCANSGAACVKIHHPKTKYIITCRQGLSKFQRLLQMWQRKAALLGRNLEDTSSEALTMQESVAPEAIVYWCIKAVHLKSGNSARTRPGFFFLWTCVDMREPPICSTCLWGWTILFVKEIKGSATKLQTSKIHLGWNANWGTTCLTMSRPSDDLRRTDTLYIWVFPGVY